jgi:hypothetical protein
MTRPLFEITAAIEGGYRRREVAKTLAVKSARRQLTGASCRDIFLPFLLDETTLCFNLLTPSSNGFRSLF